MRFEAAADLRYVGQEYTLTLPLAGSRSRGLDDRFHDAYEQRYGHASPGEPIEFVALRVAGIAELGKPLSANGHGPARARPLGHAEARVGGKQARMALYERDKAPDRFKGPAIVMEETATTLIPEDWEARRVLGGQMLLERSP